MPASTTDVNKHLETLGLKPEDLNEDAIRVTYKKLVSPFSKVLFSSYVVHRLSGGIRIVTTPIQRRQRRSLLRCVAIPL